MAGKAPTLGQLLKQKATDGNPAAQGGLKKTTKPGLGYDTNRYKGKESRTYPNGTSAKKGKK